jgi:glycosyltransferase involved in cell wall biosynthesis
VRVTICVANFNYERFVADAVDSALAQTHPDVQVLVVDDGSTDGSREVIGRYADRVAVVLRDNGGQAAAWNTGLADADGDIVIFLDADDRLLPDAAAAVVERFEADPGVALVQYPLRLIDDAGVPTGRVRPPRPGALPTGDLAGHALRYRCYPWQPTTGNAFRRALIDPILPVPEDDYRLSADAYLAELVPFCGRVDRVDRPLGDYRVHGTNRYNSQRVDGAFFRGKLRQIEQGHANLLRFADRFGVAPAADPAAPLDAAYLGFRLASLLLDPGGHPYPGDRRVRLAARGVAASAANPTLSRRNRVRRAGWFLAAGLLPRGVASRVAAERTPDTPRAGR